MYIYMLYDDSTYSQYLCDSSKGTFQIKREAGKKISSMSIFIESNTVTQEGEISIELIDGIEVLSDSLIDNNIIFKVNNLPIDVSEKKIFIGEISFLPMNAVLFVKKKTFSFNEGCTFGFKSEDSSGHVSYTPLSLTGSYIMLSNNKQLYNCQLYISGNHVSNKGILSCEIIVGSGAVIEYLTDKLNSVINRPVTTIVFNFDASKTIDDERYSILSKYGYVPTIGFNVGSDSEWLNSNDTRLLDFMKNGIDICPYIGGHTNDFTLDSTIELFTKQLKLIKTNFERLGIYNPIMGCCSGHRSGEVLDKAMDNADYHFKFIRCTYYRKMDGTDIYPSVNSQPSSTMQYPYILEGKELSKIKNDIALYVNDKYPLIMPMCHDLSSSSGDGKITKEDFTELVEFIHSLEKEGKVEVMSMRQYYRKHFPIQGENDDYTRLLMASINSRS